MKRFGGSIALTCGILGIFAPFVGALFALGSEQGANSLEANPFSLGFGALCSVVIMVLAMLVLNRRSRVFGVLLIGFCVLADLLTVGALLQFFIWGAALGGILSLFGKR